MNENVTFKLFAKTGGILFLAFLCLDSALAQGGHSTQNQVQVNAAADEAMRMREWELTHVSDAVNEHFRKQLVALFPQIREDFTHMQIVNNDMMQTVFVKKSMDYKLIRETATEINKRASRLKDYLLLVKPVNQDTSVNKLEMKDDEQVKKSLVVLDQSVMSFVTNPVFKQPDAIDQKLSAKARGDLEAIILLSSQIRKAAEEQLKNSKNVR